MLQVVANFVDIPTRMKCDIASQIPRAPLSLFLVTVLFMQMITFCLVPEVTALDTAYDIRTMLYAGNKH